MRNLPKNPRILLCNDDGIHADGLVTLHAIAEKISNDIWTVAPEAEQSGASHSLTLRSPLRIRKINEKKFSVNGTPTDCILVALRHLMKEGQRPDLILSGVNHGSNLAEDVTYSGTVAAAMEATLFGIPAIAMSLETSEEPPKWSTAEHFGPSLIKSLMAYSWPKNVFINVNFPNASIPETQGVHIVHQGQRPPVQDLLETLDPRGRPYYWVGTPKDVDTDHHSNTDLGAIRNNGISVTPIYLDLTHVQSLQALNDCFQDPQE